MTYNACAYTKRHDSRWWIFLITPSGAVARLLMSYANQMEAETGIMYLGFKLVAEPATGQRPLVTFTRANTTPR
jgi:hypothetical protein